jgi:hypothetical protein
VGGVDDRDEHFAGAMDFEGFLGRQAFAAMVAALELDLKGLAADAQGVVIGLQRPIDDGRDEVFGIVVEQGLFEDAFAGARLPGTNQRPPCWAWTRRLSKIFPLAAPSRTGV